MNENFTIIRKRFPIIFYLWQKLSFLQIFKVVVCYETHNVWLFFQDEPRKLSGPEAHKPPEGLFPLQKSTSQSSAEKPSASVAPIPHPHHQKIDYKEYREKKERERMEREKQQQQQQR